ncbi:MAG: nucleoside recognition protein [Epsilonproteobacteria bacterium]|nr:nucleoside recognition protein [Campylobacterota bacterium]
MNIHKILNEIRSGFKKGAAISLKIVAYTFPLYVLVDVLNQLGIVTKVGKLFSPFMRLIGLPGGASIVLISGFLLNLYAAIAAMAPLNLTVKQITIIGLILGIAHNLFIETAVLSRVGAKGYIIVLTRLLTAFFAGGMLNLLWR